MKFLGFGAALVAVVGLGAGLAGADSKSIEDSDADAGTGSLDVVEASAGHKGSPSSSTP